MKRLFRLTLEVDAPADDFNDAQKLAEKLVSDLSTPFTRARLHDVREMPGMGAALQLAGDAQLTYQPMGNGRYRVFGPGFFADVHAFDFRPGEVRYSVERCNNVMVNARDIEGWCERNIQ